MDVSCVFVRRDAEYYEFKEIESKEQIRIIWWVPTLKSSPFLRSVDKYRVSLHQIDAEVKQSEKYVELPEGTCW